jgi:hypothetical protein
MTYQRLLLEVGAIDHGDQLSMAVRFPGSTRRFGQRSSCAIAKFWSTNSRTRSAQLDLPTWSARGRNVTVVATTIRRYMPSGRGRQNPLGALRRASRHPDHRLHPGAHTRRSTPPRAAPPPAQVPLASGSLSGIDRTSIVTASAIEAVVTALLNGLRGSRLTPPEAAARIKRGAGRSIAVPVRTNADADPILRSPNMAGLPRTSSSTSLIAASRPAGGLRAPRRRSGSKHKLLRGRDRQPRPRWIGGEPSWSDPRRRASPRATARSSWSSLASSALKRRIDPPGASWTRSEWHRSGHPVGGRAPVRPPAGWSAPQLVESSADGDGGLGCRRGLPRSSLGCVGHRPAAPAVGYLEALAGQRQGLPRGDDRGIPVLVHKAKRASSRDRLRPRPG